MHLLAGATVILRGLAGVAIVKLPVACSMTLFTNDCKSFLQNRTECCEISAQFHHFLRRTVHIERKFDIFIAIVCKVSHVTL